MASDDRNAPRAPAACPICGKPAAVRWRPFCSARCADIDLGRWLGGRYAIPVAEEGDAEPDEEASGGERRDR